MANRAIEAKRLKMKRQGKTKRWGKLWMSSGSGPNVEVLAEYSARGRSTADPFLDRMFPGSRMAEMRNTQAKARLIAALQDKIDPDHRIVIRNEPGKLRLCLFFNTDHDCFVYVEENYETKRVRRSVEYSDRQRALDLWHKPTWIESYDLLQAPSAD